MNFVAFWREEHSWLALFSISAFIMAVETAFTRLFSVINWAEYGYFVISIVMAGFALSGVLLALFPRFFTEYGRLFLEIIPILLVVVIALSYWGVCRIDFNPYELQNETLWQNQLPKIAEYYLYLFPLFFLCGIYVGLCFMIYLADSGRVYGYNMIGSAIGSIFVLSLMYIVHPFKLIGAVLSLLTITLIFTIPFPLLKRYIPKIFIITTVILSIFVGIILYRVKIAEFPFYKPIYTALISEGNKIIKEIFSPRGYFQEIDNVTEYNRLDLSNNYETLGCGSPPRSYGLYRDGQRISAIKKEESPDLSYLKGALSSFPYLVRHAPRCLLIGTNGGFRVRELQELGAGEIVALEQEKEIYHLVTRDHASANASFLTDPRVRILRKSPLSYLAGRPPRFDVIELSLEELNASDSSKYLVTVEAVELYYESLSPSGLLAIPVSIEQLTVYALKMLENARTALIRAGVREPWRHIAVYRTSWTAMILVSKGPLDDADIRALKEFCNDRSFDVSFYPGIEADRVEVWNELPPVSLEERAYEAGDEGARDALREEALQLLRGDAASFLAENFFDLRSSTLDRPGFYGVLRFNRLGRISARISAIPQEEIGGLINYAVLIQAVFIALLIALLPLVRLRGEKIGGRDLFKTAIYFSSLGLAFLFVEMVLIERFIIFLGDGTSSFAIVVTGMLFFSGLGGISAKNSGDPSRRLRFAVLAILACLVFYVFFLVPVVLRGIDLPHFLKVVLTLVLIAPVSFAMGIPFPLGLSTLPAKGGSLLPWAWALNGAFSVISTPLCKILAATYGYSPVLWLAGGCYGLAMATFPRGRSHYVPGGRFSVAS